MPWLRLVCFTLMVIFITDSPCSAQAETERPFIIGVHPYLTKEEIVRRFTPLANYLSQALGRTVVVRVGRSYDEHIDEVGLDNVDMAFVGPAPYCKLVAKYGKKPLLVRQVINGKPLMTGEIIVREDSPFKSLSELKGKRFLFADSESTMGSILPQKVLLKAGISLPALSGYKFIEGHDNVALGVLAGYYDAGAVKEETFLKYESKGLRSLTQLPSVYDHVFVTSTKLTPELISTLQRLMLRLNDLPEGKIIMHSIHADMTAFIIPKDSDYDNVRALLHAK